MKREELENLYDKLIRDYETKYPSYKLKTKSEEEKNKMKKNEKRYKFIIKIIGIILAIYVIRLLILIPQQETTANEEIFLASIMSIVYIMMIPFGICMVFVIKKALKRNECFKQIVQEPLLKSIDGITNIDFNRSIDKKLYDKIEFRDRYYNDYYGSKYIEGKFEEGDIYISNLKTTYTTRDEDSESTHTIFEGMIAIIKLEKNVIDGYISLGTDYDDKKSIIKEVPKDKVLLDSSEFENKFDLYSSDPVKALMIFTPDEMQKILEEGKEFLHSYEISITDNIIALRVYKKSLMEGINPYLEPQVLRERIISEVDYIENIVNFLRGFSNYVNENIG